MDYVDYYEMPQIRDLQKLFTKYATNGEITLDGLPVLFADLGISELSREEMEAVMAEIDQDGNGTLDCDEFLCMLVILTGAKKKVNYR